MQGRATIASAEPLQEPQQDGGGVEQVEGRMRNGVASLGGLSVYPADGEAADRSKTASASRGVPQRALHWVDAVMPLNGWNGSVPRLSLAPNTAGSGENKPGWVLLSLPVSLSLLTNDQL